MNKLSLSLIFIFFLTIGSAQARQVEYEKNGYKLYLDDIIKILDFASALTETYPLPVADQWEIYHHSIENFKDDPGKALKNYAVLNKLLERIDKSTKTEGDFEYRLAIQSAYHKLHYEWRFWDIRGRKNLLSIIKKHNPVFEMNKGKKFFVKYFDGYETEKNGYYLTTLMVDSMVEIAEFLAKSRLSAADKSRIKQWARKDFEADPAQRTEDYAHFINTVLPQIYNTALPKITSAKSSSALERERERIYSWYYFTGVKRVSLNLGYDLMSIVTKYNPVMIEDTKNKVLISESSLYTRLTKYRFLEDVIGVPVKLSQEIYLTEKNIMINNFVNRGNKNKYTSGAHVSIQFRELWASFNHQKKNNIAKKMKKSYLASQTIDSVFQPIFNVLFSHLTINYIAASQALFFTNSNQFISQIFNDMNSRHARIIDDIANSNRKFNTRLNLQIGGATILQERGDYFVVEYDTRPGERYNVHI